jgi:hypothetical protein
MAKLAFLGDSGYNASKVLPSGYDGVKYMSNKGKYGYLLEIAR